MLKLPSRVVVPLVAALVAAAAPAQAAADASVPTAHIKECVADGLKQASAMTLISTQSARETTGDYTSRARAWVYGVPGATSRCVVVKIDGAKVRAKANQTVDHSVGYVSAINATGVLDTGEVLPINHAHYGLGGSSERTDLNTHVTTLVETDTIPAEAADFYGPELAGLAGHEVTVTLSSLEITIISGAWTTTDLAKPMTKAQRKKKLAAEVKVAQQLYDERVAEATLVRDHQLAEAATTTGLTAAWLKATAGWVYEDTTNLATQGLRASKLLARQHAAEAGQGSDTRETYSHEFALDVPLG